MHLPAMIAKPLLPCISACLHASPFKTRLGGISTVVARTLGLYAMTEQRTAVLRNGIRLPVRLSDYNGRMLYLFGTPDPKVVCVCRTLLRRGDVLLDIGANYGTVGLLSHDVLGGEGALHFIEPQPQLCEAIRGGVAQAGIDSAVVHNCGIWDEDGELTLTRPDKHTGAASISQEGGEGGESFKVPVRAIGPFIEEATAGRAFGAKVDVEGAEPRILPTILGHPGLRFVLFECNIPQVREHAWELISQQKLMFFGLSKHLFKTRVVPIITRAQLERVHDVLAIRPAPGADVPAGEFHPNVLTSLLA